MRRIPPQFASSHNDHCHSSEPAEEPQIGSKSGWTGYGKQSRGESIQVRPTFGAVMDGHPSHSTGTLLKGLRQSYGKTGNGTSNSTGVFSPSIIYTVSRKEMA